MTATPGSDPVPVPPKEIAFGLLGSLEIHVDGAVIAPSGRNQRAVLALLLIHLGRPLSTERIVDELWGHASPKTAATSVQNAVSQLRKVLGPERLVTEPAGYLVRAHEDELDATRFERLLVESQAAEPQERIRLLSEALGLWRGSPFADLASEEFVQSESRRLEDLRLVAVEERLDARLAGGRHAEAIAELQALVSRHPLRERPRGMLMLALYRSGRQAEALAVFQDARQLLVRELGLEPGPELREIHAAVLRQDRSLRPASTAEAIEDHLDRVARAILAGRVVPVLGPGAMTDGDASAWRQRTRAPTADELAVHLAERFGVTDITHLPRVSEIAAVTDGVGALHDELDSILRASYEPGEAHRFIAELPALMRSCGGPQPLIVTTGLDSVLERALTDAGEQVDLVWYLASGPDRGRFAHVTPAGEVVVIAEPNAYTGLSFEERCVVLRAHGGVDSSPDRLNESFVVREDDHIDYLLDAEPGAAVPVTVAAKLRRSHILFLGYDVDDWSLRVFLRRIWGADRLGYRSWAVGARSDRLSRELWAQRDVEPFELAPEEYVRELRTRVHALASAAAPL